MLKCSPEAFAACQTSQYCGSCAAEASFEEGSSCDKFNQKIEKRLDLEDCEAALEKERKRIGLPPAPKLPMPYYMYNPSLWRIYEHRICRGSQALANMLQQITEHGWVLVTVTQHRDTYTVIFKRFPKCQKSDDV